MGFRPTGAGIAAVRRWGLCGHALFGCPAHEMFEGGRNAMTFIEPRQPACPGPKCLAQVVNRIQAVPGNVGEWRPAVVRDSPRPEGPSHAGPSGSKCSQKSVCTKARFLCTQRETSIRILATGGTRAAKRGQSWWRNAGYWNLQPQAQWPLQGEQRAVEMSSGAWSRKSGRRQRLPCTRRCRGSYL